MSLGTSKRCCFCINLRVGSFLIAYLLIIERLLQLLLCSIHLAKTNTALSEYANHKLMLMHHDLGFSKLILSFEILLVSFEILINLALLNGLHKKIQDQVQMFYVGGFVFLVLRIILAVVVIFRYAHKMKELFGPWQWITFAFELGCILIYIYFLYVIRSYYYQMCKEETAKQWNVFSTSTVQLHIKK